MVKSSGNGKIRYMPRSNTNDCSQTVTRQVSHWLAYTQEPMSCTSSLTAVNQIAAIQSLHALRILRHQGINCELQQTVYRAVIIAKLLYASCAWWGFTTAADRQRLESFLRRARRSGFYSDDQPTFALLVEDADDTLFRKVRYSSHHLLHTLLPEQTNHPYHLRSRTHSFKLSSQHDERNFIDRMLFKNANPVCTHRSLSRQHP